jgi:hypothetical protein
LYYSLLSLINQEELTMFHRYTYSYLRMQWFVFVVLLGVFGLSLGAAKTAVAQATMPYANNLRISQVYGGGGNTGATYTHDFIEIFNSGSSAISLNGLSLQYASPMGTGNFGYASNSVTELPNVLLQPGEYFLVQQASESSNGVALPTPDYIDSTPIQMGTAGGKVVLVTNATSLDCNGGSNPCDEEKWSRIIDLVGYGNANFFEGSAAPAHTNTTALFRSAAGCIDTNNNSLDFTASTPAPRNTTSPINRCDTYNTISLDGTITGTEWKRGLLGTVNSSTFGITWDDDFWYFGAKGGFSNTDFFMIGIDADPDNEISNTGGTTDHCGATFPTENKPDYILANRQYSYTRESWGWNGSAWDQGAFNPAETSDYDFSGGGGDYEVKLRKSTVFANNGDSSPVGFYLWLSNGSCEFFNAWPPENPNGWTSGSPVRFLYAHTSYNTTDPNRTPDTYGSRVAWAANTLSANSTTYNFFGEDDVANGNPWLRMTTTASGAGGASCSVRAKMAGTNSFNNPPFVGINRLVDFTLTNCAELEVDVQMRYETGELNGVNEANTTFYRCAALPCAASWTEVTVVNGSAYTRDALNNNLLLTNVPQTQFSFWTIGDSNAPTAVSLSSFNAQTTPILPFLLVFAGLMLGGTVWIKRK